MSWIRIQLELDPDPTRSGSGSNFARGSPPPAPLWKSPRGWFALAMALIAASRVAGLARPDARSLALSMVVEEGLFGAILVLLPRVRSLAWAGARAGLPSAIVGSAFVFGRVPGSLTLRAVVTLLAGAVFGLLSGPLHVLLYAPSVLATRRARETPSVDAHDGVAVMTMLWASIFLALETAAYLTHGPLTRGLAPALGLAVALTLAAVAARRRDLRRRWAQALRAGDASGWTLGASEPGAAVEALPFTDADAAQPDTLDAIVLRDPSSAYRGEAGPFARTSLVERPPVSLLRWTFTGVSWKEAVVLVLIGVGYLIASSIPSG